jgi:hypothetical protein
MPVGIDDKTGTGTLLPSFTLLGVLIAILGPEEAFEEGVVEKFLVFGGLIDRAFHADVDDGGFHFLDHLGKGLGRTIEQLDCGFRFGLHKKRGQKQKGGHKKDEYRTWSYLGFVGHDVLRLLGVAGREVRPGNKLRMFCSKQ